MLCEYLIRSSHRQACQAGRGLVVNRLIVPAFMDRRLLLLWLARLMELLLTPLLDKLFVFQGQLPF